MGINETPENTPVSSKIRITELMEFDVLLLASTGILLVIVALLPLSISFSGIANLRPYLLALGIIAEVGTATIQRRRRKRAAILFDFMKFLKDRGAVDGEKGIPKTVVQSHLGARTEYFNQYLATLLKHQLVMWDYSEDGRPTLTLTEEGLRIIGVPEVAEFIEMGRES